MAPTAEEVRAYMLVYYVGLFCICWYDWLVTLKQEYNKIWKADWSIIKVSYLINRYAMLGTTIAVLQGFNMQWSTSDCDRKLLGWQTAFPVIVYAANGVIMMMRTYAIWNCSKLVLVGLGLLHVVHIAAACWAVGWYVRSLVFEDSGPCIPVNSNTTAILVSCLLAFAYDLAVMLLGLYKNVQLYRSVGSRNGTSVLSSLLKHGFMYVIVITASTLGNLGHIFISQNIYDKPYRGFLGGNICTIVSSIAVARLVLALKTEQADDSSSGAVLSSAGGTSWSSHPRSGAKVIHTVNAFELPRAYPPSPRFTKAEELDDISEKNVKPHLRVDTSANDRDSELGYAK